jgi:hypothetical protein
MTAHDYLALIPDRMKSIQVIEGEPQLCLSPEGVSLLCKMVGTPDAADFEAAVIRWVRERQGLRVATDATKGGV